MKNFLPKILITGANGQLGTALRQHKKREIFTLLGCSHVEMDITQITSVQQRITHFQPDLVINTAAYTAVDRAEQESKEALQVNYLGTQNLAIVCEKYQIPLIHISTDYVFDGTHASPYREDAKTNPLNMYGKSKWMGEEVVREHCSNHIILRVSGVFSEYQTNFLKTMLRLASEKSELRVVADQMTCPTAADDIADALYIIADSLGEKKLPHSGTYHYCSAAPLSWYQFASAIIEEAKRHKTLPIKTVKAISAMEYQTPAQRPAYSVLDCSKIHTDFAITQPSWEKAVKRIVPQLLLP